ncbi:TolC family protein [Planctomycetales bacterium ZRK34]|nr:TolC family protein [Planctomycetales bacterium ZRK34]
MHRFALPAGALALTVLVAGCSSPLDDKPFAEWLDHDPPTWTAQASGAVHRAATLTAEPPPNQPPLISPDAGADQYVELALRRNPSIRAAEQRVQELTQRIAQARSLDDPMVNVAPIGEMAETAAGQVGVMSSISQKLPTPGKLDARGRIAAQDVAMAAQDLEQAKLRVMADTRRAYWSYYFTSRAIEVINAERVLLEQFRDAASARYEAGTAQQQDVLRASVEVSNLDNRLITIGQQRDTAAAMLNRLLDRHVATALPTPRPVELSQLELKLDSLLADAAQSNPSLQKVRDRIEAYRQRLKLAKLNRLPDLNLSLTYNGVADSGLSRVADGKDQ